MTDNELAQKAIAILMETLGPIETARFLSLPREQQLDSVQRHRLWQAQLDQKQFLEHVFKGSTLDLPETAGHR